MKIGDIYKNKNSNELIQINSFATHMNNFREDFIIVYINIENSQELGTVSFPHNNGYGTQEEIENEYDLLVTQEELNKYEDWKDIFELIK